MTSSAPTCESDLAVVGLQPGEEYITPVRLLSTLISVTIVAVWTAKKMRRLSLFFAHWLCGVVLCLGFLIDDMMVTVCWAKRSVEGFLRTVKFIELSASNMLAITNLAICVNLALIVSAHRTLSRVKSVSSPRLILVFLVISLAMAAVSIPFWDNVVIVGTGTWLVGFDDDRWDILDVLTFMVEFFVGVSMLFIVIWLLLFRMKEVKECWMLHLRIRYYFGLTIIGTAVNLGLGICGTIRVSIENTDTILLAWTWMSRYIHIALDTIVLYGVLRERSIDERGDDERSGSDGVSSEQHGMSRGSTRRASGGSHHTGKPAPSLPLV